MNRTAIAPTARSASEGGVRVLFIGNSITLHGIAPQIGWTNCWGMAASAREPTKRIAPQPGTTFGEISIGVKAKCM